MFRDGNFSFLQMFNRAKVTEPIPVQGEIIGTGLGEARVERLLDGRVRRVVETKRLIDDPAKLTKRNEHIKRTWSELNASSIPTMTGVEFCDDPRIMIMDDLSRGGQATVISTPDFGKKDYEDETRKGKFFSERENIKFVLSNAQDLSKELSIILQKLVENGFHLLPRKDGKASTNMFYLVIDNNSFKGELLLWDLTRVQHEDNIDEKKLALIRQDNRNAVAAFIGKMNKYLDENSQLDPSFVEQ